MNTYWFKRKAYGWGWTPSSWEGWTVIVAYLVIVFANILRVDTTSHSAFTTVTDSVPLTIFATFFLLLICYVTGESPKWQWGEKKVSAKRIEKKVHPSSIKKRKHTRTRHAKKTHR